MSVSSLFFIQDWNCSMLLFVFSINSSFGKSMKPLHNIAANGVHGYAQAENALGDSWRGIIRRRPVQRAHYGPRIAGPTQISHLERVLILRDENSIYKHAQHYPFRGLKHLTVNSVVLCRAWRPHGILHCSWHEFVRSVLHLIGKADPKSRLSSFL